MSTAEPWTIDTLLGETRTCAVYRGHHPDYTTAVAIKIVRLPRVPADAHDRTPLRHRLDHLKALRGPGINALLDWRLEPEEAELWIALELLDGTALSSITSPPGVRTLALALAGALDRCHRAGVVHGDLKPDNLFIAGDDRVVIVDFALPTVGFSDESSDLSAPAGAPAWLAPECFDGAPASAASDVYALGQILQERSTGRPAFSSATRGPAALLELARAKARLPHLEPASSMIEPLRSAVRRATRARPVDRGTARDLWDAARATPSVGSGRRHLG